MRKFLTLLLCLLVTPVSAQSWIANAPNQSIPFNNNGYLGYINWTNGCILTYQTGTASGTTGGFPVCTTAAITASMLAPGAAAANLNAGGLLKPSITSARTLAMLGDSITFNVDDANLTNGPCVGLSCEAYGYGGYGTWASVYSGYRVWRAPNTGNCGESGGTIAQILANISCVTALNPDVVIYEGGGNDPGSGSTCASATAANRAIYSAFKAAGIAVIKVGIYPRTSPVAFTTSQASIAQCLNMEDRRYAQEVGGAGWYFVDVEPIMVDPAQTGSWATRSGYMLADGAHPSTVGSSAIGYAIAQVLNQLSPPWLYPSYSAADLYDATNNVGGNLLTNGLFTGSGGSVATCSGVSATSWTLATGGLGGGTCVGAVSTSSDGRPIQTITLGGTSTGSNLSLVQYQGVGTLSNISAGDTLEGGVWVNWSGLSPAVAGLWVQLKTVEGGQTYTYGGMVPNTGVAFPASNPAGSAYVPIITTRRTVTATPTTAELDVSVVLISLTSSSALTGVISMQGAWIKKVIN